MLTVLSILSVSVSSSLYRSRQYSRILSRLGAVTCFRRGVGTLCRPQIHATSSNPHQLTNTPFCSDISSIGGLRLLTFTINEPALRLGHSNMTTPPDQRPEPTYNMDSMQANHHRSSGDDGTYVGESLSPQNSYTHEPSRAHLETRPRSGTHLTTESAFEASTMKSMPSLSQTREQASRLNDDLAVLQIEQELASPESPQRQRGVSVNRGSMTRIRSKREDLIDQFDTATNPLHEQAARYKPPENPSTSFSKFFKKVHNSSWLVRYFTYITPIVLLILIPLLVGALAFPKATVGGVRLVWFSIWLMIVWLSLWAGRVSLTQPGLLPNLIHFSFSPNAFPGRSASLRVYSQTTARSGEIWASNSSCQLPCSFGG